MYFMCSPVSPLLHKEELLLKKHPVKAKGTGGTFCFHGVLEGPHSMGMLRQARHGISSPSAMNAKSGWSAPIPIPPSCISKQQQECSAPAQKLHPTLQNKLQPCWGSH